MPNAPVLKTVRMTTADETMPRAPRSSSTALKIRQVQDPAPQRRTKGVVDEAWGSFYRAYKRVNERVERDLTNEHQIGLSLLEILYHIDEAPQGSIRMLDISHLLVTSPSSVTRNVDKLNRQGL